MKFDFSSISRDATTEGGGEARLSVNGFQLWRNSQKRGFSRGADKVKCFW